MGRSATTTVLFSDIVGSTEHLARLGERAWDDVRRRHFSVLREALSDHDGVEIKNTGDGLMAVFGSVVDGVDCAVSMQQRCSTVEAGGRRISIRIGVSTGEAQHDRGDWFGTPVVQAARLCGLAGQNESWTTALVRALVGSQSRATFAHIGEQPLKGFDQPVDVYALHPRDEFVSTAFADLARHQELGDRLVAGLDYWDALPSIQRVRAGATAGLAPLPGDVICDIGCGPGTELIRIARIVGPAGTAIGVDPSASLLGACRDRAEAENVPVQLVERDGRDTGLPDGHCDGVRMERVLQHVGDVSGLLGEAIRITRPGGRVVMADSDWGSLMVYPGDRTKVRLIKELMEGRVVPEPWAGRLLHHSMLAAGLVDVESTIYPVQADRGVMASLTAVLERFVNADLVPQHDVDDLRAAWDTGFERGGAVFAFCMFVASGRVPEAPVPSAGQAVESGSIRFDPDLS